MGQAHTKTVTETHTITKFTTITSNKFGLQPQGNAFLYGEDHRTSLALPTSLAQFHARPAHNRHKKAETSKALEWPWWPSIFDDPPDETWPFHHQRRAHIAETSAPLHAGRAAETPERRHRGRAHAAETSVPFHAVRAAQTSAPLLVGRATKNSNDARRAIEISNYALHSRAAGTQASILRHDEGNVASKTYTIAAIKTPSVPDYLELEDSPSMIVAGKEHLAKIPTFPDQQDIQLIRINFTHPPIRGEEAKTDVREIAYWLNGDGRVVFDGDILAGPLADITSGNDGHRDRFQMEMIRDYFFKASRRIFWSESTTCWLQYKFDTNATRNLHLKGVDAAISDWKRRAPYLLFSELPISANTNHTNPDILTITSRMNEPNYSTLGGMPIAGWERQINFQPHASAGDYRHQWGHQLGLRHEYQMPTRQRHMKFHCEALSCSHVYSNCDLFQKIPIECCLQENESAPCCRCARDFEIHPALQNDFSKTYDAASVMQYQGPFGTKEYMTDILD